MRTGPVLFALTLLLSATDLMAQRRIRGPIQDDRRVALRGGVHPLARAENDLGRIDSAESLSSVTLVFRQTASQQADLEKLLAEQQDPSSPNYRRWLTPEEYGNRFGLPADDLAAVTAWLTRQNLRVTNVPGSRTSITFSGSAGDVERAMGTPLHRYRVAGKRHFANVGEPSLPAAIEAVVAAIQGLHDFGLKPRSVRRPVPASSLQPNFTSTSGNHYLSPADLATIYNIKPLHDAGFTGAGQSLVIPGQTRVPLSDLQQFRSRFGLPPHDPEMILVPGSRDPGIVPGDIGEADLDIEWASAVAPDARVIYVYSTNVLTSIQYAIEQNLAPVISLSYGLCELEMPRFQALSLQSLARQGNAQGITWFNASGDSGGADCVFDGDTDNGGLAVDVPASIPEVTGVGGTEFDASGGTFWSATNSAVGASVLSYIPETTWNTRNDNRPNDPASGGGGSSVVFSKPSWQTGAGVPGDAFRNVPDVALTSSAQNTGYLVYTEGQLAVFGGTSAASPAFAGIATLLNQYLISTGVQAAPGLGNMNPKLYSLAQTHPGVFHDVSTGDNIVSIECRPLSQNCVSGSYGFSAGSGYDRATGLGSVDAYAFVLAWKSQTVPTGVTPGPPVISGVTNGASFQQSFAPGAIVSLFGSGLAPLTFSPRTVPLPAAISGVSVTVNGVSAPLYYVSPGQLNVQIPYEISPGANMLAVNHNGQSTTAPVNVSAAAPGLFTGQNGAVVPTSVAARGQVIELYLTGAGAMSPSIATGAAPASGTGVDSLPRPVQEVQVTVGGIPASILFAGNPVGLVGVTQVNVEVPVNAALGTQSVAVSIGGAASAPATLTVTGQ